MCENIYEMVPTQNILSYLAQPDQKRLVEYWLKVLLVW